MRKLAVINFVVVLAALAAALLSCSRKNELRLTLKERLPFRSNRMLASALSAKAVLNIASCTGTNLNWSQLHVERGMSGHADVSNHFAWHSSDFCGANIQSASIAPDGTLFAVYYRQSESAQLAIFGLQNGVRRFAISNSIYYHLWSADSKNIWEFRLSNIGIIANRRRPSGRPGPEVFLPVVDALPLALSEDESVILIQTVDHATTSLSVVEVSLAPTNLGQTLRTRLFPLPHEMQFGGVLGGDRKELFLIRLVRRTMLPRITLGTKISSTSIYRGVVEEYALLDLIEGSLKSVDLQELERQSIVTIHILKAGSINRAYVIGRDYIGFAYLDPVR